VSEEKVRKMIRLQADLLRQVEDYAERRRGQEPGVKFDATDAIRVLLRKGLDAERKEGR
jgi:hypothetical protein